MKKLLLVGLAVVLVTVAAAGIASGGAWFTTTETLGGGKVTTGTLDLKVTQGGLITISNIEPGAGYVPAGSFCLKNVGNYDMRFRGQLVNVADYGDLGQYLQIRATINPEGMLPQGVLTYGPSGKLYEDVSIEALEAPNNPYMKTGIDADPFYAGYTVCYGLEVQALETAPNSVQGKTYSANLYIEGIQDIDPTWQ